MGISAVAASVDGSRRANGFSLRFGTIAIGLSIVVLAVGLAIAGSSLWVSDGFKRNSAESAARHETGPARDRVKTAAKSYLATDGNAAIARDWAEF